MVVKELCGLISPHCQVTKPIGCSKSQLVEEEVTRGMKEKMDAHNGKACNMDAQSGISHK